MNNKKLVKENEELKKKLEFLNNELEKYKKYRGLYLNLLNKVKSNKNLISNINLNNQDKDKDKEINKHYNNYVNELIENGKEINSILKEDEILEQNIKEILSNLE